MAKPKYNPEGILKTCGLFFWETYILQGEGGFRQQMGLTFKKETRK
jgi:hypothetical protein